MGSLRTLYSDSRTFDNLTRSMRRLKREYPLDFEDILCRYKQSPRVAYFKMKLELRYHYDFGAMPVNWMETVDAFLRAQ